MTSSLKVLKGQNQWSIMIGRLWNETTG